MINWYISAQQQIEYVKGEGFFSDFLLHFPLLFNCGLQFVNNVFFTILIHFNLNNLVRTVHVQSQSGHETPHATHLYIVVNFQLLPKHYSQIHGTPL